MADQASDAGVMLMSFKGMPATITITRANGVQEHDSAPAPKVAYSFSMDAIQRAEAEALSQNKE